MLILFVVIISFCAGVGAISLLAYLTPPPAPPKVDTRILDFTKVPPSSKYHGGAEEKTIKLQNPAIYAEIAKDAKWEAEYAGFEDMDFFTFDCLNPQMMIVGRRFQVGDFHNGQIVVNVDGVNTIMLPPRQALSHIQGMIEQESAALTPGGRFNKKKAPVDTSTLDALFEIQENIQKRIVS